MTGVQTCALPICEDAELVVMTHKATEGALAATVKELSGMDVVRDVASVLRVIGSTS